MHTIVHHLDVVAGARFTHPVSTGFTADLGSSPLENLLDRRPGSRRTTGHKRGAIAGALLAAGHTGTDEKEALGFKFLNTADGIRVVRVATVNDDITLFEVGGQLIDEVIDSRAGFDEEDDLARALEFGNELFNRVSSLNVGA